MGSKKKIRKAIESLDKQIKKHEKKIRDYEGSNEYIMGYWEKEIKIRRMQKAEKEKKLNEK